MFYTFSIFMTRKSAQEGFFSNIMNNIIETHNISAHCTEHRVIQLSCFSLPLFSKGSLQSFADNIFCVEIPLT